MVITGATGYVGSHLLARLLETHPDHAFICLARGRAGTRAEERVRRALRTACADQGKPGTPRRWLDRVVVGEEDLTAGAADAGVARLLGHGLRPSQFWHCAASIKFAESVDRTVWNTNVAGLSRALGLADLLGVAVFNHVSTAYVAGTLGGTIPETTDLRPGAFNNVYEESKLHGERLVTAYCQERGLGYRVLRPSIIVGHSRTYRTSTTVGLYHVLELLRKFRDLIESRQPGYFRSHPLRVPLHPRATLNLIPIDVVVAEMTALAQCGPATLGQVFHITNEEPLNLVAAMKLALSAVGVRRFEAVEPGAPVTAVDHLFAKGLRHYRPYLDCHKTFDRSNVARHGADLYQRHARLDQAKFGNLVRWWIDHLPAAVAA
jgi:nucleoside-diphosphate-sugar epimerase